jgi:hypothetical protein
MKSFIFAMVFSVSLFTNSVFAVSLDCEFNANGDSPSQSRQLNPPYQTARVTLLEAGLVSVEIHDYYGNGAKTRTFAASALDTEETKYGINSGTYLVIGNIVENEEIKLINKNDKFALSVGFTDFNCDILP